MLVNVRTGPIQHAKSPWGGEAVQGVQGYGFSSSLVVLFLKSLSLRDRTLLKPGTTFQLCDSRCF